MAKPQGEKLIVENRRARHDYHLLDRVEAGLVLAGTEVKALRDGKSTLQQAYAEVRDGEAWLVGLHIPEYGAGQPREPRARPAAEAPHAPAGDRPPLRPGAGEGLHARPDAALLQGRPGEGGDRGRRAARSCATSGATIADRDAKRQIDRELKLAPLGRGRKVVCSRRGRPAAPPRCERRRAVRTVSLTVNDVPFELELDPRELLVYVLRERLDLTGTVVGCDTSSCGACTVLLDGESVKSCTVLGVQADGHEITTIEGLAESGSLNALQESFHEHHALQCGYCTSGMVLAATSLLAENPSPSEEEIRHALEGNICRCTGYQNIVDAIGAVAR